MLFHQTRRRLRFVRPVPAKGISRKENRKRLERDRERLKVLLREQGAPRPLLLIFYPPYLCVRLHRLAHHFYTRGHKRVARLFWQVNLQLTGADISPRCDIGGGLVIPNPAAVSISANAGENLTVMALAGAGGLVADQEDIGSGPGLPVLGDDVYLAPHSGVLGPARIGDRVRLGPGCIVSKDVPDDSVVEGYPPRFSRRSVPS